MFNPDMVAAAFKASFEIWGAVNILLLTNEDYSGSK
jgi:hypothetical protein